MARYKLVRLDGSRLITGEELRQQLLDEGFTVPIKVPLVKVVQSLPKPIRPLTHDKAEWVAYRDAWNAYSQERMAMIAENKIRYAAYFKQFSDFADVLRANFILATGNVDKTVRPFMWNYEVLPEADTKYSYKQAAGKLMGQYVINQMDNPIEFIANQNF